MRLVTNPRVFEHPEPTPRCLAASPHAGSQPKRLGYRSLLNGTLISEASFLRYLALISNLVPDAHLAVDRGGAWADVC